MTTIMRNFLFVAALMLLVLLAASRADAQSFLPRTVTGSLTAVGSVTMPVDSLTGSVAWQLTGTFSGTVSFEGTVDGVTWEAIAVVPIGTAGVRVLTATTTGIWRAHVAGLTSARARVSIYTSGTVAITGKRSAIPGLFGIAP
jgi:hypothetical protein